MYKLTTVLAIMITFISYGQNDQRKYIRIFVEGVNTQEQAMEVDSMLRSKEGIITSRMDYISGLYFCIYNIEYSSKSEIILWIESLGYNPKCFISGTYGNGSSVQQIDTENCQPIGLSETTLQQ